MEGIEFGATDCQRIFKISKNAFYRRMDALENPTEGKRQQSDELAKECIRHVVFDICKGWVFGAEMLHYMILFHCDEHVNEKRILRLLDEMGLKVSKRWDSPYLGHDTHDHPCDSFVNLVGRRFYRKPRAVILTDITYLYYGPRATRFFKCSFIDAFTAEELGTAESRRMDKRLLIAAYKDMMAHHEGEFPEGAILHSDQGSQMKSRKFRQMVKKDGFIQSMSNRGNSLDNSPMESFFRTFKDENSLKLMRCNTYEDAVKVSRDYKEFYNTVRTHTGISGWIPGAFYERCMELKSDEGSCGGCHDDMIYVPECMAENIADAIEARRALNKGYGTYDETREKEILERKYLLRGGAVGQMDRDEKKLSALIRKHREEIKEKQSLIDEAFIGLHGRRAGLIKRAKDAIKFFENEILRLMGIQDMILKAREFYHNSSEKVRAELADRRKWKDYPEMFYYKKMKGMF